MGKHHVWSREDLTGRLFGRLNVIEKLHINNRTKWRCRCICGKEVLRTANALTNKRHAVKSCGCYIKEYRKTLGPSRRAASPQEGGANAIFRQYQINAEKKGLAFELTKERWLRLTQLPCVYCGALKSNRHKANKKCNYTQDFTYNGIDRVDSAKGYIESNCVSCCGTCNLAKRHMPVKEFLDWVDRIFKYQHQGESWVRLTYTAR